MYRRSHVREFCQLQLVHLYERYECLWHLPGVLNMVMSYCASSETLQSCKLHRIQEQHGLRQHMNGRHTLLVLSVNVSAVRHKMATNAQEFVFGREWRANGITKGHGAEMQWRVVLVVDVIDRTAALEKQSNNVDVRKR